MKVLIISYFYPPFLKGGSARFFNFAPWFKKKGWDIHILTTARYGSLPEDVDAHVTRIDEAYSFTGLQYSDHRQEASNSRSYESLLDTIGSWVIPDTRFYKFGLRAFQEALKLHARIRFDAVITTSSPESSHLLGVWLKKRLKIKWIADFRDGWMFERPAGNHPLLVRPTQSLLEKYVVNNADAVVAVTAPITHDFNNRYGGLKFHTITNSFQYAGAADRGVKEPARAKLIAHIGQFSLSSSACDIEPLLMALHNLKNEIQGKLRFVFAGRLSLREQMLIQEKYHLSSLVDIRGILTKGECDNLMKDADWLLLVTDPVRKSVMTAKIFDYFSAGKPILALASGNAAAEAINQTRTGIVAAPENAAEIEKQILRIADNGFNFDPDESRLRSYTSESAAGQYVELMNQICSSKIKT